jgi:hypothetical protein
MRCLTYIPLLAAVLPLTLADYTPPAEDSCSAGAYRCDANTLQVCGDNGTWETSKECSETEYCMTNDLFLDSIGCFSLVDDGSEVCTADALRCNDNKIQDCGPDDHWSNKMECRDDQICTEDCGGNGCSPYCRPRAEASLLYPDCKPESFKCDNYLHRLLVCNNDKAWETKQICANAGDCVLDAPGEAHCERAIKTSPTGRDYSVAAMPKKTHSKRGYCDQPGNIRCAYNPARVQQCSGRAWMDKEVCSEGSLCRADDETADGDMRARCVELPNATRSIVEPVPRGVTVTCTPGEYTCSSDFYSLLVCTPQSQWVTAKKCTTPGDCMIDSPGHAHCQRGGIDPPKPKAPSIDMCNQGDLACDSERRFIFECDGEGTWNTNIVQCFAPGYCRAEGRAPLTCAGFPRYGGDDGKCNSHCESMDYLYCLAVSSIN